MAAVPMIPDTSSPARSRALSRIRTLTGTRKLHQIATATTAILLVATQASALLPLSMEHEASVPVGANARSFTAADCNGDGRLDLVAAGQNSDDVIQHLNTGGETFEFDQRITVGTQPTGAACADFDGDGQVDLAAISRDTGRLNVYRRTGPNSYEFLGFRTVGFQPISLAAGDLNADQKLDLIAVNEHSDDMTVLFGTGAGVPLASTVRVPTDKPRAAAIADFNLDGRADIALAAEAEPTLVVLLGTGTGYAPLDTDEIFSQPPPANGVGVAAGDFTNDGIPDIAFLSEPSNITLYEGNGLGEFTFFDGFSVAPQGEAIHIADFNQDDKNDLAVLYRETSSIEVFLSSVPGHFPVREEATASTSTGNAQVLNSPRGMVPRTPLGPSPLLQMVRIDESQRTLQVVSQTGQETFAVTAAASFVDQPKQVLLADLNNDGVSDAIVGVKTGGSGARTRSPLQILLGTESGGYGPLPGGGQVCGNGVREGTELCDDGNAKSRDGCSKICLLEISREVTSMVAADFNHDNNVDVVVVDGKGAVLLLEGDGSGRFARVRSLSSTKRGTPVALADFNGDSSPDLALIPKSRSAGTISALINDGAGGFIPMAITSEIKPTGPLLAGDFDNNGTTDLVVGYKGSKNKLHPKTGVAVMLNDNGAGPARTASTISTPSDIQSLAAGDFDEDGSLDLIAYFAPKKGSASLLAYRGSNGGFFSGSQTVNDPLAGATIADVNTDQHHDLVSCAGASCRTLWGSGGGQFGSAPITTVTSAIGPEVRGGGAGDFDKDGHIDIVGISKADSTAVVIFGADSTPPLGRLELPTGGIGPTSLAVADFNGDGLEDFLVINEDSQDRSLFTRNPTKPRDFLRSVERLPDPNGVGAVGLTVGDFNGDNKVDIAVSQSGNATVTPLININAVLVAGEPLNTGPDPRGVAVGHLNGDAVPDVVTANRAANTVTVLLSQAGGTYARSDFGSGGLQPSAVALLDLNNDNFDDIVVLNEKIVLEQKLGNTVTFLNNGSGAFPGPPSTYVRGRQTPRSICVGNFDGDTHEDVAIGSFDSSDILVLHGNGTGGWKAEESTYAVGKQVTDIDCHDADGDGLTDIAFGRHNGGDAGVVLSDQ